MLSKHFSSIYRSRLIPTLYQAQYCSTDSSTMATTDIKKIEDINIVNGLPHVTIPLPSRNELCVFALKPISNTVGDFLEMLKQEDKGKADSLGLLSEETRSDCFQALIEPLSRPRKESAYHREPPYRLCLTRSSC